MVATVAFSALWPFPPASSSPLSAAALGGGRGEPNADTGARGRAADGSSLVSGAKRVIGGEGASSSVASALMRCVAARSRHSSQRQQATVMQLRTTPTHIAAAGESVTIDMYGDTTLLSTEPRREMESEMPIASASSPELQNQRSTSAVCATVMASPPRPKTKRPATINHMFVAEQPTANRTWPMSSNIANKFRLR